MHLQQLCTPCVKKRRFRHNPNRIPSVFLFHSWTHQLSSKSLQNSSRKVTGDKDKQTAQWQKHLSWTRGRMNQTRDLATKAKYFAGAIRHALQGGGTFMGMVLLMGGDGTIHGRGWHFMGVAHFMGFLGGGLANFMGGGAFHEGGSAFHGRR